MQGTQKMQLQSLGWEDSLEEETATHSSSLVCKSHGQKSLASYNPWDGKESQTRLSEHTYTRKLSFQTLAVRSPILIFSRDLIIISHFPRFLLSVLIL